MALTVYYTVSDCNAERPNSFRKIQGDTACNRREKNIVNRPIKRNESHPTSQLFFLNILKDCTTILIIDHLRILNNN